MGLGAYHGSDDNDRYCRLERPNLLEPITPTDCWRCKHQCSPQGGRAYEPKDRKITSSTRSCRTPGEDAALRKSTYEESNGWYSGIVADMFG
ncbi:FCSD flavin-binding domain-containing protein [Mesorhizobium sp. KR9-304]|uniref:FCSD flavin-binding domain-containing protein n=1 Tax=Mesorhizobium sp. KR9-304 TaxID=3156614 RepID=UPI0032B528B3